MLPNANHMLLCVYQMLTKCYHVYLFFCFYLCYYYHRQVRQKTRNKNLICISFAKEYGQEWSVSSSLIWWWVWRFLYVQNLDDDLRINIGQEENKVSFNYDRDYPFEAFITNLGKYNEDELIGEWLKFPTTPGYSITQKQ